MKVAATIEQYGGRYLVRGGATDTVSSFIYREYRDRSNVGYGTALAEFYLIAIIIFITVLLVVGRRVARRYGALPAVAES